MKKSFLLFSAAAVFFSCNSVGEDEYVLNGSIQGVPDGKNVILERNSDSTGIVSVDTVKLEKGKFRFEGKILEPEMHSISIDGVQNKSYVILENGEIDIEINKDSIFANKISGTPNNEQLTEFNKISLKIQQKVQTFQNKNQQRMMAAQVKKDTAEIRKLRLEYLEVQKEMETATSDFIEKNPTSLIAALLIQSMFNVFEPDLPKIEKYYSNLSPELKKNKIGKRIAKQINEFKVVQVGRYAPDFTAPNTDGKPVSMKQSMGKLTIIDFWASWCGPCRKANPELVKLYQEFHPQGLNIIGVSLDKPGDEAKWKEAIAKDGLTWTNVSNLKYWNDPIAKRYGVESIPAMFIVNERGVVIARDLHGEALQTKVRQFLTGKK